MIIRKTFKPTGARGSSQVISRELSLVGCFFMANKFHGYSKHPLYHVWKGIKNRCYKPSDGSFRYYGARGIKMCYEWLNDCTEFIQFALEHGWRKGLHTDRINSDGNYEPSNVRFVSGAENYKTRRQRQPVVPGEKVARIGALSKKYKGWSKFKGYAQIGRIVGLSRGAVRVAIVRGRVKKVDPLIIEEDFAIKSPYQLNHRKVFLPKTTSKYKGVCWSSDRKKWIASTRVNGKYTYLGRFGSEVEAALAYDNLAREVYGKFAILNFPEIQPREGEKDTSCGGPIR